MNRNSFVVREFSIASPEIMVFWILSWSKSHGEQFSQVERSCKYFVVACYLLLLDFSRTNGNFMKKWNNKVIVMRIEHYCPWVLFWVLFLIYSESSLFQSIRLTVSVVLCNINETNWIELRWVLFENSCS